MTSPRETPKYGPRKPADGAVILLSGGLDSYTTAALARDAGYTCHALTVLYGQRHACEVQAARQIAQNLTLAEHKIIELDLRTFGGSALTADIPVPKEGASYRGPHPQIPPTYFPPPNTLPLSLPLPWAQTPRVFDLFIGANAVDYSGYPDCRAEFLGCFEGLANLATKAAVEGAGRFRIHAPVLFLTKGQIILQGRNLDLDYALTHSCYDPDEQGRPCGRCDSCLIRRKGFDEAHLRDPLDFPPLDAPA